MMRFFDTHCDTVMRHFEAGHDFVNGVGSAHLDLPRLLEAGHCVQVFAVFAAQSHFPVGDVTAYAEQAIAVIHGWETAAGGRLRIVRGRADLASVQLHDNLAGLIGLEGADPLDGDPENLAYFFDLGVRLVIPAWDDNAFSGAATGSGGPLTEAGIRLIELAEALGIMVDVSHLSDRGFEQLCVLATRPFIASHSNCRALCPSPRNLTDEQIHTIADRGGAIGVNLRHGFPLAGLPGGMECRHGSSRRAARRGAAAFPRGGGRPPARDSVARVGLGRAPRATPDPGGRRGLRRSGRRPRRHRLHARGHDRRRELSGNRRRAGGSGPDPATDGQGVLAEHARVFTDVLT